MTPIGDAAKTRPVNDPFQDCSQVFCRSRFIGDGLAGG